MAQLDQVLAKIEESQTRTEDLLRQLFTRAAAVKGVECTAEWSTPAAAGVERTAPGGTDEEALFQRFKQRLAAEAPALLEVLAARPELEVTVERRVVEAAGDSLRGRLARLLKEGFFDPAVTGGQVQKELTRRGYNVSPGSLYPELDELAAMGFLTVEPPEKPKGPKFFKAVAGMKVNVKGA
jgi:hypothetical protein